ncbi:Hypothetical protein NTJ_06688 [Nesidiocoris tenuis]|uniref:Uncharacterized protein n=1 Tax=Nesidiocoris tenuis TaxID=355587 RepID=A0ABN7ANS4_9HEMI|nr:Hypothetical protein NTJ_06688 [Nesidiocoris tenuis]
MGRNPDADGDGARAKRTGRKGMEISGREECRTSRATESRPINSSHYISTRPHLPSERRGLVGSNPLLETTPCTGRRCTLPASPDALVHFPLHFGTRKRKFSSELGKGPNRVRKQLEISMRL